MIKLYGVPVSNYFNATKLALMEKGFEFEEIRTYPSQEANYLEMSPMGKIPCIEAREGFLSETNVILEFLEEINPEIPLLPEDAYQRAKVRELMKVFELYIDTPVRQLLPGIFGKQELSEETKMQVRSSLEAGLEAVARLASLQPYMVDGEYSFADIYGYYVLSMVQQMCQKVYQWELLDAVSGLKDWFAMMAARPMVKDIDQEASDAIKKVFSG